MWDLSLKIEILSSELKEGQEIFERNNLPYIN